MAMPSADTDELAKFGYEQELDQPKDKVLAEHRAGTAVVAVADEPA